MKISICLALVFLASAALAQKTVTFTDVQGSPHENVQIISADAEWLTINDHDSITSVLYTNIRPADLESMGVAPEHVELASRAQRERDAALAAEKAANRTVIWTLSLTVILVVTIIVVVVTVTSVKANRLRERRNWLEHKYDEAVAQTGTFDDAASDELSKQAICVGFQPSIISEIRQKRFLDEVQVIKNRIADSLMLTDEDKAEIGGISERHRIKVEFDSNMILCRNIFVIERENRLPPPMKVDLMLEPSEEVYAAIPSVWLEPRVVSQGYVGSSISIPTGLRGVNFRFGGYSPIRTEQVTALSSGTLYVTSERLLFSGESQNTSIKLKRIIDGQIYSDGSDIGLRVEKDRGKPDYFSMSTIQARYALSLIGALRKDAKRGASQEEDQ